MSPILRTSRIALVAGFIIALPISMLFANEAGEHVVKRGVINDDVYLAGGEVEMLATVQGDVTVAGGQLELAGDINGDVMAAGGRVTVRSTVADDARLAGGEIQVFGSVGDDVIAAGGRIRLGRDAKIGGKVWVSGGDLRIDSDIAQELRAIGGRVRISGKIAGDVYARAEQITIDSSAVISGNLFTSGQHEPQIAEGARIDGQRQHTPVEVPVGPIIAGLIGIALVLILSLMVTGVVLYLIFPQVTQRTTQTLRDTPWACLGYGLAVFAATPVLIVILLSTGIGIWLALILLLLYLIMLLLGYLTGAFFVGEAGLRLIGKTKPSKTWHAFALCVALLVLLIVNAIPLLGTLIYWLVLLAGIGALGRETYLAYKGAG